MSVGLTEPEAVKKFGAQNIKVYSSDFINLYYGSFYKGGPGDKPVTKYKLICQGPSEKVVGLHMIGECAFMYVSYSYMHACMHAYAFCVFVGEFYICSSVVCVLRDMCMHTYIYT